MTQRRRLHVVGCQRSGTTLMMELLWSCFALGDRCEHEQSLFEPIPDGAGIYLTKKPPDTNRIEPVFPQDDELFVVSMLRDPRAVITSRHAHKPDVYFSSFHRWLRHAQAIERWRDHPRWHLVRYEELLRDPQREQERLLQRFPFLQTKARFADYPHAAQIGDTPAASLGGVRPFDTSRIDGWREHLPRVKGQVRQFPELIDAVKRFGYEPDDSWLQQLDGVAEYTQDYKEQPPHWLRRAETELRFALKVRRYRQRRGLDR